MAETRPVINQEVGNNWSSLGGGTLRSARQGQTTGAFPHRRPVPVAIGAASVRVHWYSKHVGQIIWDRLDCAQPCRCCCCSKVVVSPNICWNYWCRPDKWFFCPLSFFFFFFCLLLRDGNAWETLRGNFGHCGDSRSSWTLAWCHTRAVCGSALFVFFGLFAALSPRLPSRPGLFSLWQRAFNFPVRRRKGSAQLLSLQRVFLLCSGLP